MQNEKYEQRLIAKVSGKLKSTQMDYRIENVKFIWVVRKPTKMISGRLGGALYNLPGVSEKTRDCVIIYSCDIADMLYGIGEDVQHQWTNPNWVEYHRPFYDVQKRKKSGRPKKNRAETA